MHISKKIHTPIEGPPVDGPALAPLQVPKVDFGGLMGNGFSTFLLVSACLGLRPLLFLTPFSLDLVGGEAKVPKKEKINATIAGVNYLVRKQCCASQSVR